MKTPIRSLSFTAAALALAATCTLSVAQDEKAAATTIAQPAAAPAPAPNVPTWSSADLEQAAAALAGSWKATAALPDGTATDVVISVAPVGISGLTDVMYVEMARADGLNRPYRTCFWRLVKTDKGAKLQTLEFRRPRAEMPCVVGLWAAPSVFPLFTADDVVSTAEIDLTGSGGNWTGKTPVPYPTIVGGATHMTNEITFGGGKLETADRGFDASGKQVWGPAAGQKYTFTKFDTGVKARTWDGGLVVIDFPGALTGEPAKQGEMVTLNYAGYLTNGEVFDSSYERDAPFQYNYGTPLIEGWNKSMETIQAGMKRRLVIPGAMAYGERGRRPKIPSNATLIFDIDVLKIEPAPAPPPPVAPPVIEGNANVKQVDGPPPEIKKKMEEEMARKMKERAEKEAADKAAGPK